MRLLSFLLLIVIIALATACGGASEEVHSRLPSLYVYTPKAAPTVSLRPSAATYQGWQSAIVHDVVAHDAEEAMGVARARLFACPPYCAQYGNRIESLEYVLTTIGQLRILFGHALTEGSGILAVPVRAPDTADDAPTWAIVAHGSFSTWCMACTPNSSQFGNNFWILVRQDTAGMTYFGTDQNYDMSRLGEVHDVPLPLAQWPTPVALETPAATDSSP